MHHQTLLPSSKNKVEEKIPNETASQSLSSLIVQGREEQLIRKEQNRCVFHHEDFGGQLGWARSVVGVYWVSDGVDRCLVGFLHHHLVKHLKKLEGALCQVTEV